MRLGLPRASQCVFRETFRNVGSVQRNSGIIVASSINQGISPTSTSARVTYDWSRGLLAYADRMTIRLAFKMFSVNNAAGKYLICKMPAAANDNQFFLQFNSNRRPALYVAASIADAGNYATALQLTLSESYVLHAVYNGSLAAASRVVWYTNGVALGTGITGTIPTSMRATSVPITIFNGNAGSGNAPDNDFVLYEAHIQAMAMSAAEVLDDYLNLTYQKVVPS